MAPPTVSFQQLRIIGPLFAVVSISFWFQILHPSTSSLVLYQNNAISFNSEEEGSYLSQQFPECVIPDVRFNVTARGKYVSSKHPPRYDQESCFLMKARYNCAYRPVHNFTVATDYQFAWRHANASQNCDLRKVVDQIGGPQGIADTLGRTNSSRPLHVLLQGSSYIRQIFEALVCGFQNQITDFRVQVGGPDVSLSAFRGRNDKLVTIEELGQVMGLERAKQGGCHGEAGDISKYYRRNALKPPNNPNNCNDNIAMVEFGGSIRFYYIFRPTMYDKETLTHIYQTVLGIPNDELDVLVWNNVLKQPQNVTLVPYKRHLSVEALMWNLRELQLRDVGQYFGANNPWIKNPPDYHPCMPGVPDDEVDILLFLLLTGKGLM